MKTSSIRMYEHHEFCRVNYFEFLLKPEIAKDDEKPKKFDEEKNSTAQIIQKEMNEASFQLRFLRKQIYDKIDLQQIASLETQKYRVQAEHFVHKFRKKLTESEIKLWKNKIKKTEKDVKKSEDKLVVSKERPEVSNRADSSTQTSGNEFEHIQNSLETKKVEVEEKLNASVKNFFDSVNKEVSLVENLPNVPSEENSFDKQNTGCPTKHVPFRFL